MYESVVDDPKVQRLSDRLFKTWINLLCIASQCGGALPSIEDICFVLRLSVAETQKRIEELISAGLIDRSGGNLVPHNWNGRQYKHDVSTERVKRFRERHPKRQGNGSEKRHETVSETQSETAPEYTEDLSSQVRNDLGVGVTTSAGGSEIGGKDGAQVLSMARLNSGQR